jgi:hypothetical protein
MLKMAIEIKKSHRGLFTKKAKEHGMGVQEYAKYILANKDNQDPRTVKQANFAHNFAQFGIENLAPTNLNIDKTQENYSNLGYSNGFDLANIAAVLTTMIANKANDVSGLRSENNQYLKAIQPRAIQNKNPNGLNDTPAYFKTGGEVDQPIYRPELYTAWGDRGESAYKEGWMPVRSSNGTVTYKSRYGLMNSVEIPNDKRKGSLMLTAHPNGMFDMNIEDADGKMFGEYIQKNATVDDIEKYFKQKDGVVDSRVQQIAKSYKNGGDVSKDKAKEILRDGTAQGHKLTDKQKRYFGWIAGGKKAKYGMENSPVVNAENGEVFQSTDGSIYDINGENRHEQGGVDLSNVQRVLENTSTYRNDKNSQLLKLTPEMVADLGGLDIKPKRAMSHAQAAKFLTKKLNKQVGDFEKNLDKNTELLKDTPDNLYTKNSLQFNTMNLSSLPTKGDIFDKLFNHQEMIKNTNGIDNGKKMKYGGHKYVVAGTGYDDTTPYSGGKTKKGRTTPTGKDNAFQFDINDYNDLWKRRTRIDSNTYPDNQSFQKATYAYLLQTNPQLIRNMWANYGNTDFGIKNKIGQGYDFNNLTDDQLSNLTDAYSDNLLGARSLIPPYTEAPLANIPQSDGNLPPIPNPPSNPDINVNPPSTITSKTTVKKDNRFFEPLRWFDIAAPLLSYLDSSRIPNKYNPVNLNEVRLKQLNPEQALQRGQQDFNAVLGQLPNTGAGNANAANVFSQKYAMDNQVIGNYDNQNAQIKNQETLYNANVRDKQSFADAQSRDTFEQKVLASREAQRQQKLTALDDLFTRVALNHKLNREGNLMMQLFPNFDQNAQYNGRQRYFASNSMGSGMGDIDHQLMQLGVNPKDLTNQQKLYYLKMKQPKKSNQ